AGEELEVAEEKCFVLPYWPADGGTILVLGKVPTGNAIPVIEIGVGIERAVAEIFPYVSVEGVVARLDAGVHNCACRRAKFRGVGARLYTELLERIGWRLNDLHRA